MFLVTIVKSKFNIFHFKGVPQLKYITKYRVTFIIPGNIKVRLGNMYRFDCLTVSSTMKCQATYLVETFFFVSYLNQYLQEAMPIHL